MAAVTSPSPISVTRKRTGSGFPGIILCRRRYQQPQFGGGIRARIDHRPVLRHEIGADDMERGVDRAIDVDRDHAVEAALVQEADGIGVADRSVGELHRDRVAVMQHVDVEQRPRQHRVQHDRADGRDHGGIGDGARPHDAVDRRLAGLAPVDVDVVVVADQPGFPADLGHHGVAGIDAQAALDAVELRPVADIDPVGQTATH